MAAPSRAINFANEIGLSQLARHGYGAGFQRKMVERSYRGINAQATQTLQQGRHSLISGGMEFSGANQSKLPSEIAGGVTEAMGTAQFNAWKANEQARSQFAQQYLGVLQGQDQMDLTLQMEKQRREDARGNGFDKFLKVAGLAAMFVPGGQAVGAGLNTVNAVTQSMPSGSGNYNPTFQQGNVPFQ